MGQDQIDYWIWWNLLQGGEYGQEEVKSSTETEVGKVQKDEGCSESDSNTDRIHEAEKETNVHEE